MNNQKGIYLSIGEVAASLHITRRIILNYEDKGLIFPDIKEGKNGTRYYNADSFTKIHSIRNLQTLGLSLDEIYTYYNNSTPMDTLVEHLECVRDELNLNIEKLYEHIKTGNDYHVQRTILPKQVIYRKTIRSATVEERTSNLREVFLEALHTHRLDTTKRFLFIEYPLDDPALVSFCIAVPSDSKGENIVTIEAQKTLSIFYHGKYEKIPSVKNVILDFAHKNDLETTGICRHIYLEGPPQHDNPDKYITQVAVLIV